MAFPKALLVVSAGLFVAWLGFLLYLVVRTQDPVILSRPQLCAVSALIVVADVHERDERPVPTVTVKAAWTLAGADAKLAGTQLTVDGLADCDRRHGWTGPGEYILPLTTRSEGQVYEVTPLPLSPGYRPTYKTIELVQVGPDKDKVVALVGSEISRGILRRNVPWQEAIDIKKKLEAAKASVRLSDGETRIYRATPDALKQLE